ncbi:MAG: hypothetical protein ACLQPN_03130 [Bryobacteraceae bacterium]
MKAKLRIGGVARVLCVLLAEVIVFQSLPVPAVAQAQQQPTQLNISILEGEGSINNIHQRVTREAMVQVSDENHKPVAGVAVTFFLPEHGASGVFSNGGRSFTIMTDDTGRAVARGIVPNKVVGKVQIRVVARFRALQADTIISQTNVAAAAAAGAAVGGAISGKLLAIILVVAAAGAAGGAVAATRGGGASPTPVPTVTITVGTPTVGAPH